MRDIIFATVILVSFVIKADDFSRVPARCNQDVVGGPVQEGCAERIIEDTAKRISETLAERYEDEGGSSDGLAIRAWCERQSNGSRNPDDFIRNCIVAVESSF